MNKKLYLIIPAALFILLPLYTFLTTGSIVTVNPFYPQLVEYGALSLIIGISLLIVAFLGNLGNQKNWRDYLLYFAPFIIPIIIFRYTTYSTILNRIVLTKIRECSPIIQEQTGGFVDTDKQIACFEKNKISFEMFEVNKKNIKEARPIYPTNYFPFIR